jgi:hypothetical protein
MADTSQSHGGGAASASNTTTLSGQRYWALIDDGVCPNCNPDCDDPEDAPSTMESVNSSTGRTSARAPPRTFTKVRCTECDLTETLA